jgi:hypothetical protein
MATEKPALDSMRMQDTYAGKRSAATFRSSHERLSQDATARVPGRERAGNDLLVEEIPGVAAISRKISLCSSTASSLDGRI